MDLLQARPPVLHPVHQVVHPPVLHLARQVVLHLAHQVVLRAARQSDPAIFEVNS
ncbi:MAG: hypothetical protein HN444_02310 [Euryarchaeota archaeon]|nr:hypothetical protein [Euryarchaeota archaeon]